MQLGRIRLIGTVLCLTFPVGCADAPLSPDNEQRLAERAMDGWVREHPDGWAMAVTTGRALERPEWTPSCSSPETNGYVSLRVNAPRGEIELAFRCPIDERTTAQELQDHFVRAVPWNLAQVISAPNWRFQAWLPESSIFDGVTFHTPVPGLLAINIATGVTGIRGESTRAGCAAEPANTEGCVLSRRHAILMQVRFTVPADLAALR